MRDEEFIRESTHRRPGIKSGGEQDAFTGWRHVMCYMARPGVTKKIKRKFNRKARRQVREELRAIIS